MQIDDENSSLKRSFGQDLSKYLLKFSGERDSTLKIKRSEF